MKKKSSYNFEELIECGNGKLFGPGNAKLPLPPMLMFDRISEISENKGSFKKGTTVGLANGILLADGKKYTVQKI